MSWSGMKISVPAASLRTSNSMKTNQLIIIGLDGVPCSMLKGLAEDGIMPNTEQLIQEGWLSAMHSAAPEISCVAWSSIITGVNAGQHGIFGFMDMHPGTYDMRFPNYNDLKAEPFWNHCPGKSIILNVPATYPVREMDGVHVSGFVSLDINKSIHPASLVPHLVNMDYRLDVDTQKAHTDIGLFLVDVDQTLCARIKAVEYLWDYLDWHIFMPTFTVTDRLMHFLFDAYEDPDHQHHNVFLDFFRRIDEVIGWIYSRRTENDTLILLSDHGFCRLEKDVYINVLLANEGVLSFKPNKEPALVNIAQQTKAFALDPGRIYINQKGKYPAGCIEPQDKENCLKDLENLFSSLYIGGRKVIKHMHRKEQVYAGPCLDDAPDLILIAEQGFNLKGAMTAKELTSIGPFTGQHTYEDAFLLLSDKNLAAGLPDELSVIDAGQLIRSQVQ